MVLLIEAFKNEYGRPVINNEWLNRLPGGCGNMDVFPMFYLEKVGSYSWGLMQGLSQTFEPTLVWYNREEFMKGQLDLTTWQHDLYRFNGFPYASNEINLIKRFTHAADKRERIV